MPTYTRSLNHRSRRIRQRLIVFHDGRQSEKKTTQERFERDRGTSDWKVAVWPFHRDQRLPAKSLTDSSLSSTVHEIIMELSEYIQIIPEYDLSELSNKSDYLEKEKVA